MSRLLLISLVFLCSQSAAQVYLEVGPSFVSYKNTFGSSHIKTNQQIGRVIVGYESSSAWSGEFMTGVAQLSNSSVYLNDTKISDLEIKFNKAYAIYLKGNQLIGNDMRVFGRIGYASVAGSGSYQSVTEKFQNNGASYGVGMALNFERDQYLSFDYLSFLRKNEMKINVISVSYGKSF